MEPGRRWIEQYGVRRGVLMIALVMLAFWVIFPPAVGFTGQWGILRTGRLVGVLRGGTTNGQDSNFVFARAGETLVVEYDAEIDDGLFYVIVHTSFVYHPRPLFLSLKGATPDRVEVPIEKTRLYVIGVDYAAFKGRYDVTWEVR